MATLTSVGFLTGRDRKPQEGLQEGVLRSLFILAADLRMAVRGKGGSEDAPREVQEDGMARLDKERKACFWVCSKGERSIKERKRTQSSLGFNRRQSHVLPPFYYPGISPLIVSGTLQGLPFPIAKIQVDTGLSTKLFNSLVFGSFSSISVSCTTEV